MTRISWTLAQAKCDLSEHLLAGYTISRADGVWSIFFEATSSSSDMGPLLDDETGVIRLFPTLEGVVEALESIGFRVDGFAPLPTDLMALQGPKRA